jgi:hypothetical protein
MTRRKEEEDFSSLTPGIHTLFNEAEDQMRKEKEQLRGYNPEEDFLTPINPGIHTFEEQSPKRRRR